MFQTVQAEPVTECSNEKERQKKKERKAETILQHTYRLGDLDSPEVCSFDRSGTSVGKRCGIESSCRRFWNLSTVGILFIFFEGIVSFFKLNSIGIAVFKTQALPFCARFDGGSRSVSHTVLFTVLAVWNCIGPRWLSWRRLTISIKKKKRSKEKGIVIFAQIHTSGC